MCPILMSSCKLDLHEEQWELETIWNIFSGKLPLSDTMRPKLECPVRAHKHRYAPDFDLPEHEK